MTAAVLPVDARVVRPLRPLTFARGVPTRSTFRRGILTLDESGILLCGSCAGTPGSLTGLGGFSLFVSIVSLFALGNPALLSVWMAVVPTTFFIGIVAIVTDAWLGELRLTSTEITIPWSDLVEVQFDPRMRWATLIFQATMPRIVLRIRRAPESARTVRKPLFLPLRSVETSTLYALRDALEVYAPQRILPDAIVYEWTPRRRWAATIILALFGIGIAAVCVLSGIF